MAWRSLVGIQRPAATLVGLMNSPLVTDLINRVA